MRHSSLALVLAGIIATAPVTRKSSKSCTTGRPAEKSKAVNVLKAEIEKKGHTWKDSAIAGGGGQNAMTVLKTRAVSGNPPAVVQMRAPRFRTGRSKARWLTSTRSPGTGARIFRPRSSRC